MSQRTGYRLALHKIYIRRNATIFEEIPDVKFAEMAKELQKTYPGNYTVEEYYNPERGYWGPKLVFETEADEVWFKLQYE